MSKLEPVECEKCGRLIDVFECCDTVTDDGYGVHHWCPEHCPDCHPPP